MAIKVLRCLCIVCIFHLLLRILREPSVIHATWSACLTSPCAAEACIADELAVRIARAAEMAEVRQAASLIANAARSIAYWSIENPARRFCCQHSSVDSEQNGFSLP
jgi:hypothetical protein